MNTVLVLDVFTNGHEAALEFIALKGWKEDDYRIVFCGTHAKLLQEMTKGPAFGVVPVFNSIAGEVKEVTTLLAKLRGQGYVLEEVSRTDLKIDHCLLVPKYVTSSDEISLVMSHEKALQQCGNFLDKIGIAINKRSKASSTGNAAKRISNLTRKLNFAAIAPKAAAEAYGLKILAEGIQDTKDNKTTFVFLENKAKVEPVTVGIIGIEGRFGQLLKSFFEGIGCKVIGSDQSQTAGLSNVDVVEQSKVVIFSVPIKVTVDVIRSVMPYVKEDQLLMDVTSIKEPAVSEMLKSAAQVVGLHPMFRPEVSFDGQTVVVCPARLTSNSWKTWVVNMLTAMKADIKYSTPSEHDKYMAAVQVIPHLANLVSALLIKKANVSVEESLAFTSPFYKVMFSLMGRLVSQNPDLYISILMENPETLKILDERIKIEQTLMEVIKTKDHSAFEKLFLEAKKHFGSKVTKEANELFMRILGVLSTLYGTNSTTLEFNKGESKPGLLTEITKSFSEFGVNLTGINSVTLDQRLQFTISFEQPIASNEVRLAFESLEKRFPNMKVI